MVSHVRGQQPQRLRDTGATTGSSATVETKHDGHTGGGGDVVGGGGTSTSGHFGAGAKTALQSLHAVEPKKPGFTWKSGIASALVGLSVMGALTPSAQAQQRHLTSPQRTELVLPFTTGPPVPSHVVTTTPAHTAHAAA